ncbi:hypothetical protein FUAX_16200 [Fulvitalea axinellae]|uniref:Putative glutamine amidotransferase domain-containing protein n=2 Tax=Fulvitalea axinellae TaxID=1182444 RepID=A0AAU9CZQ4_9BACT|nr:hypothetical protein FUAX_16200 [Fulvitalea axinellae]
MEITFEPYFSPYLIILVAVLSWAVSFLLVRKKFKGRKWYNKLSVILLRTSAVFALAWILMNPVRRQELSTSEEPLKNIVLIDQSKSMGIETPVSRFKQLKSDVKDLSESVRTSPNTLWFGFGNKVRRLPNVDSVAHLECSDGKSDLSKAIVSAVSQVGKDRVGNLVLCTDGRLTDKPRLRKALDLAVKSGIKVSAFGYGKPESVRNLAVKNCVVRRFVRPGVMVPMKVVVEQRGMGSRRVEVLLKDKKGKILDRKAQVMNQGESIIDLKYYSSYDLQDLTVEIPLAKDELLAEDNKLDFKVKVDDPKIKVLYLEGTRGYYPRTRRGGSWEAFNFIYQACVATGKIDITPYVVNFQRAVGGQVYNVFTKKKGYPKTKEELLKYDVVIISDINRSIFNDNQLKWTRELVEKHGGGFCMIGGNTSFGSGGWDKTVLEKVIPVDMSNFGRGMAQRRINVKIPEKSLNHPIWRIDPNVERNKAIILRHPVFSGTNVINKAKPAATVLAFSPNYRNMPLIAVQPYGKGRSMAFMSDAAGGWGEGYQNGWGETPSDNNYYRRFWVNTVNWLAENKIEAKRTKMYASTESVTYNIGELARVTANLKAGFEADRVTAEWMGKKSSSVKMAKNEDGYYSADLKVGGGKLKRKILVKAYKDGEVEATDTLSVKTFALSMEILEPDPDFESLALLVEQTGGDVINNSEDMDKVLGKVVKKNLESKLEFRVPVWDKWFLLLFLLLALGGEWLVMKYTAP